MAQVGAIDPFDFAQGKLSIAKASGRGHSPEWPGRFSQPPLPNVDWSIRAASPPTALARPLFQ